MEKVDEYLDYYHSDENLDNKNYTKGKQFQRRITKFLWWCAGADTQILLKCPMSDRVKYAGIGGLVFCTGLLAFISGSYAFYEVFGAGGDATDQKNVGLGMIVMCIVGGLIWGLIVLNMDRFIISSTGKGIDGADDAKITWAELRNGVPRILIALILGLVISAPLEIRIQKDRIDRELQEKQNAYLLNLNTKTNENIALQLKTKKEEYQKAEADILNIKKDLEKRRKEIEDANQKLIDEIAGRIGSGIAGEGPAADAERKRLKRMQNALDLKTKEASKDLSALETRRLNFQKELDDIEKGRDDAYAHNIELKNQMDGLVERLEISHEIGHIWLFILLMFLAIEMGPIFFKMMVSKGVYEFLCDNQYKKMKAKQGIIEIESTIDAKDGTKIAASTRYLEYELERDNKQSELDKQKDLSKDIIDNWHSKKKKDIQEKPDDFYSEE